MKKFRNILYYFIYQVTKLIFIYRYGFYKGYQLLYRKCITSNYMIENLFLDFDYRLKNEYNFQVENYKNKRASDICIKQYSDDSLLGYGELDFQAEIPLEKQQRFQCISMIENVLLNERVKNVVEIGCGNGDLLYYLKTNNPNKYSFTGIDFSVKNASLKYKDINFISGYALDKITSLDFKIDLLFMTSTVCVFTPNELISYVKKFRKLGIQYIAISEPVWGPHHLKDKNYTSFHLEGAVWQHNYSYIFQEYGAYKTEHSETLKYQHPISTRPDIYLKKYIFKLEKENL
jgi:SAM-dependent methyltransferase